MMTRTGHATGRRTIAIVGGGFCGTTMATRLLRSAALRSTDILLIERNMRFGRGIAYAPREFPYLLNVPAAQMSADPQRPGEFLEFARQAQRHAKAADFLPRVLYGEYLEQRLDRAAAEAPADVRLVRVRGEVTAAAPGPRWRLSLRAGNQLFADQVILALGNEPPAPLESMSALEGSEHAVLDPRSALSQVEAQHSVLLVGTGLTMVDVAVSLDTRLRGKGALHALSRRGLLPRAHRALDAPRAVIDDQVLLNAGHVSLRALTRAARAASLAGTPVCDWRDVVDSLRRLAPSLWQLLTPGERSRFLRHLRPWWDAHRHRMPADMATRLERMRAAGTLRVHAGRIETAKVVAGRIHLRWRPRTHQHASRLIVDRVVNCTGPAHSLRASSVPLIRALLEGGWIAPDPLGLGLSTGVDGEIFDASGAAVRGLYYVGPLLRARYWEATAVPELRHHVERTASALERRVAPVRHALRSRDAYATEAPAA